MMTSRVALSWHFPSYFRTRSLHDNIDQLLHLLFSLTPTLAATSLLRGKQDAGAEGIRVY